MNIGNPVNILIGRACASTEMDLYPRFKALCREWTSEHGVLVETIYSFQSLLSSRNIRPTKDSNDTKDAEKGFPPELCGEGGNRPLPQSPYQLECIYQDIQKRKMKLNDIIRQMYSLIRLPEKRMSDDALLSILLTNLQQYEVEWQHIEMEIQKLKFDVNENELMRIITSIEFRPFFNEQLIKETEEVGTPDPGFGTTETKLTLFRFMKCY